MKQKKFQKRTIEELNKHFKDKEFKRAFTFSVSKDEIDKENYRVPICFSSETEKLNHGLGL